MTIGEEGQRIQGGAAIEDGLQLLHWWFCLPLARGDEDVTSSTDKCAKGLYPAYDSKNHRGNPALFFVENRNSTDNLAVCVPTT